MFLGDSTNDKLHQKIQAGIHISTAMIKFNGSIHEDVQYDINFMLCNNIVLSVISSDYINLF